LELKNEGDLSLSLCLPIVNDLKPLVVNPALVLKEIPKEGHMKRARVYFNLVM